MIYGRNMYPYPVLGISHGYSGSSTGGGYIFRFHGSGNVSTTDTWDRPPPPVFSGGYGKIMEPDDSWIITIRTIALIMITIK